VIAVHGEINGSSVCDIKEVELTAVALGAIDEWDELQDIGHQVQDIHFLDIVNNFGDELSTLDNVP